jgi:hypothetical protein
MRFDIHAVKHELPDVEQKKVSVHREGTQVFVTVEGTEKPYFFSHDSEEKAERRLIGLCEFYGVSPAQPDHTDNGEPR